MCDSSAASAAVLAAGGCCGKYCIRCRIYPIVALTASAARLAVAVDSVLPSALAGLRSPECLACGWSVVAEPQGIAGGSGSVVSGGPAVSAVAGC